MGMNAPQAEAGKRDKPPTKQLSQEKMSPTRQEHPCSLLPAGVGYHDVLKNQVHSRKNPTDLPSWEPARLKPVKKRGKGDRPLTLALMRVQCRELFSWS